MAAIPGSVRLAGFAAPTDSTDTYAVTDPTYGRGSLRSVANITARNAITKDRRLGQLGMEVLCIDTMTKYRLINEPGTDATTNSDWSMVSMPDFVQKVYTDISHYLNVPATQILNTSGAGDLAAKISTLVDGDILEIQANASYSAITIPGGMNLAIRVAEGYDVELNSAKALTLNNACNNIFISGIIFDSNTGGGNDYGSAIGFQHQAIVNDVIFYNCTFRNNNAGAITLSYHQSIGGDFYYTANLLSEFSTNVSFVNCNFDRAANDATEGAAITMRGVQYALISDCNINARSLSRGIQLQNCLDCYVIDNHILNAGGGGNGEGIKMDQLGTPTYYNTGTFYRNRVHGCIEGIDIDDTCNAFCYNNIISGCSNEGLSLDDSSTGIFVGNVTFNNLDGIRLELGSVCNLKCNVSFNNSNSNYLMDNGYVPDNSNTTSIADTFIGADKIPYDNTTSSLTSTLVNDAIDELKTLIVAENLWLENAGKLNTENADDVALNTDKAYEFKQPTNSTFYSTFSKDIDADYSVGSATGTASGGAAIVAGELDLAHTDNRYVSYVATSNADSQQAGAFKCKVIPNYSSSPAAVRPIFSVASALSANLNEIALWHAVDGTIRLNISNSVGSPIISNYSFGVWGQTALTEYEFELDFDITTGSTRLFINGTQVGSTNTSTGTRNSSIGVLLIGQLAPNPTFLSNIYVKDFIAFNAVQHTSNYSPGYTLQNIKLSKEYSAVKKLQVFDDLNLTKLLIANGILQTDANGKVSSSVALPNGTTGTTQIPEDNSTLLATDAFVQQAVLDYFESNSSTESFFVKQFGSDKAEIYYPLGTTGTGFVNVAADFPVLAGLTNGDCWTVPDAVTVTDNDPTKTNTGQTFVGPIQIAWDAANSKWQERDGLTVNTAFCSIATALYLVVTLGSPRKSVMVLDNATYTFGDGQSVFGSICAPMATIICQGSVASFANTVIFDTLQINTLGSWSTGLGSGGKGQIVGKYAYVNGTPPPAGIFINSSSNSDLLINVRIINGGGSGNQTLSAQSGRIKVITDQFIGLATVTIAGGSFFINTLDRSNFQMNKTLGQITIGTNEDEMIATNNSIGKLYGGGSRFWFNNNVVRSTGSENIIPVVGLSNVPIIGTETSFVNTGVISGNSPKLYGAFLCQADMSNLAGIPSGVTAAKLWAYTSFVIANYNITILLNIMTANPETGYTVTMTGSGSSRVVTASGNVFVAGDANGDPSLAGYIITPKGMYQIIAYSSATSVTITVPAGYVNESTVAFTKLSRLFGMTSQVIVGNIYNPQELTFTSNVNPDYINSSSWQVGNTLALLVFGNSAGGGAMSITVFTKGNTRYSFIETPQMLPIKSSVIRADNTTVIDSRLGVSVTDVGSPAYFDFQVPQDARGIYRAEMVYYSPASGGKTGSGIDIDLDTQYTVSLNGATNEKTGTDHTSTYTIAGPDVIQRISFLPLIPDAVAATNGTLKVDTNFSDLNAIAVQGTEIYYY